MTMYETINDKKKKMNIYNYEILIKNQSIHFYAHSYK